MAQYFATNSLLDTNFPLTVGIINNIKILDKLSQQTEEVPSCDLYEVRLDSLNLDLQEVREKVQTLTRPLVFTARHPDEGGDFQWSREKRESSLLHFLDLATAIDVELRSASDFQSLLVEAKKRKVHTIGSFHDFQRTPSTEVLLGSIDFAHQFQFDIAKIACTLRDQNDFIRLMQLLAAPKKMPLSVMGMGALGGISRLTLGRCGSLLNYGFLEAPNVSGQISASRLKTLLSEF